MFFSLRKEEDSALMWVKPEHIVQGEISHKRVRYWITIRYLGWDNSSIYKAWLPRGEQKLQFNPGVSSARWMYFTLILHFVVVKMAKFLCFIKVFFSFWNRVSHNPCWPQTSSVPKDSFEFMVILPFHLPKCWDYKLVAPCQCSCRVEDWTKLHAC